jgi:acyl carrier protein
MNNSENEKSLRTVYKAVQSFNEQLPVGRRLDLSPECALVGSPNLDSVEIVNLLVMIEQQIEQDLGIRVTLFDVIERLVSIHDVADFLAGEIDGRDL